MTPGTTTAVPALLYLLFINVASAQAPATPGAPSPTSDSQASQGMPGDDGRNRSDNSGAQQAVIAVSVVLGLVLLCIILFGAWIVFRRWQSKRRRRLRSLTHPHLSPDVEDHITSHGIFPVRLSNNSYQSVPMSDEPRSDRPKHPSLNESLLTDKDDEAPNLAEHPAFRNFHQQASEAMAPPSNLSYLVPARKPVGMRPKPKHESAEASLSTRAQFDSNSTLGDWGFRSTTAYDSGRRWVDSWHQAADPFITPPTSHTRNISDSSTASHALLDPNSRRQSMYRDVDSMQDSLGLASPTYRPSTPLSSGMSPTRRARVDVGLYEQQSRSPDGSPQPAVAENERRRRSSGAYRNRQASADMDITEAIDEDRRPLFHNAAATWPTVPKREYVPWQMPSTESVNAMQPQIAHVKHEHLESVAKHDITSPDGSSRPRWSVRQDRPKSSTSSGVSRLTAEASHTGQHGGRDGQDSAWNSLYDVSPNSEAQETSTAQEPVLESARYAARESVLSGQVKRNLTAASASSAADSIMTSTTASPFTNHMRRMAFNGRPPTGDGASWDVASEAMSNTAEKARQRRQPALPLQQEEQAQVKQTKKSSLRLRADRSRSPFNLDDFQVPQLSPIFGPDDGGIVYLDQVKGAKKEEVDENILMEKGDTTEAAEDDQGKVAKAKAETDHPAIFELADTKSQRKDSKEHSESSKLRHESDHDDPFLPDKDHHYDRNKNATMDTTWGDPTVEESAFEQHGVKHTRRWIDGTESRSFNEMYGRRPVGSGRGSSLADSLSSAAAAPNAGDGLAVLNAGNGKEGEEVAEEVVVMMKVDARDGTPVASVQ